MLMITQHTHIVPVMQQIQLQVFVKLELVVITLQQQMILLVIHIWQDVLQKELDVLKQLQHVLNTKEIKQHVKNSKEQVELIIVGIQELQQLLHFVQRRNALIFLDLIIKHVMMEWNQLKQQIQLYVFMMEMDVLIIQNHVHNSKEQKRLVLHI